MLELQLTTTGEYANLISDYLLELGALAITLTDAEDNPIFEPELDTLPLWPEIKLAALFSPEISLEEIVLNLYTHDTAPHIQHLQKKIVDDADWVKITQALTQPQCFGENLWIYPSWHTEPQTAGVKILLDPGLAFGTGSHATTALMLTWLAEHPPKNLTVLDFGCGSGILGIAAAKLGAQKTLCTDIDPQALTATQENAARNHLTQTQLMSCLPDHLPKDWQVDLILANILALPLVQLVEHFRKYLKPKGILVLSGILAQQTEMLKEAYAPHFSLLSLNAQNEWIRMVWQLN